MTSSRFRNRSIAVGLAVLIVALVAAPTAAAPKKGGGGGGSSGAPANLRVTGVTAYSVSLAWDAAGTNTSYYYIAYPSNNYLAVAAPQTTATVRSGIRPGFAYTFTVKAVTTTGQSSATSNSVTATTPLDTTPPTKPALSVTDVRPTSIALAWSSTDDGPDIWFSLYVDGQLRFSGSRQTSAIVWPLQSQSSHSFVLVARDHAGLTASSDSISATTAAKDLSDTAPPTVPGIFSTLWMPDGETWLSWTASTDNTTPQRYIQYRLYVNGVLDNWGLGFTSDIVYGEPMAQNVYSVEAIDENDNVSQRSSITIDNF